MNITADEKKVYSLLLEGKPTRYSIGYGLYFRVSSEETGFWTFRYTFEKRRREITIGRYGQIEPDVNMIQAVATAEKYKRMVRSGLDPSFEKKRSERFNMKTVDQLAEDWLEKDIDRRLKHPDIPRRIYRKELSPVIGQIPITFVSPIDISNAIEKTVLSGRPATANDVLMYSKQLFAHGVRLGLLDKNPAEAFTNRQAGGTEKARTRFLTVAEIEITFTFFHDHINQFKPSNYLAIALLLSLGVRKSELIGAKWSEFDLSDGVWVLPADREKTEETISIPLSSPVVEWLKCLRFMSIGSDYVFPARKSGKRRDYISDDTLNFAVSNFFKKNSRSSLAAAGVQHFTVHDLRRTFRTLLAACGVPDNIYERCLNHKLKGVEGVYNLYDYFEERKHAMNKVSDIIAPIVNKNILSL